MPFRPSVMTLEGVQHEAGLRYSDVQKQLARDTAADVCQYVDTLPADAWAEYPFVSESTKRGCIRHVRSCHAGRDGKLLALVRWFRYRDVIESTALDVLEWLHFDALGRERVRASIAQAVPTARELGKGFTHSPNVLRPPTAPQRPQSPQ